MNGGGIIAVAAFATLAALVCVWVLIVYRGELRKLPYLWENVVAPRAGSPEAAYEGFYEALGSESWQHALRYVSREHRGRYRELLNDPEVRRRQLADKSVLRQLRFSDCGEDEACRRQAVYEYDYEISEGFWDEVMGKRFFVAPGKQTLEMSFIELPSGRWQISEL